MCRVIRNKHKLLFRANIGLLLWLRRWSGGKCYFVSIWHEVYVVGSDKYYFFVVFFRCSKLKSIIYEWTWMLYLAELRSNTNSINVAKNRHHRFSQASSGAYISSNKILFIINVWKKFFLITKPYQQLPMLTR